MDKFKKHIENIIQKVLNEAAEEKAAEVSEKLHGNQKKIASAAEPKDKITADDFKKLRSVKKKETKEQFEDDDESFDGELELDFDEFDPRDKSWEEIKAHTGEPDYSEIDEEMIDPKDGELDEIFFYDDEEDESVPGDYEGDEEEEEEAEELSAQEPTYVGRGLEDNKPGKMFGSFSDDHGWYDEIDRQFSGDFDFDYDEEEFSDFDSFMSKYDKKQRWFAPGEGKRFFDMYQKKFGGVPFRVRTRKMMEQETEEGNAFTGALADAKEDGKKTFKVDGKTYNVKEEKKEKKWIQKTDMKKGALHKKLGVPEGDKIPKSKLNNLKKELMNKAKGEKKLTDEESKLLKQVNLALTLKDIKESTSNKLRLSEDELIDLIENIIKEQATKKVKGNIADKTPVGLELTQKVLRQDKKENDGSLSDVGKKMSEYLKDGSKGKFEENPKSFPKGNGELAKMDKKAYEADSDVEEYIEEFSYGGGMENLDYDEIKPNEEWMEKTLEGSSKTGNSSEYANAVETDLGKKINAKRKKNMFSQEKKNSYKKDDQPTSGSNKSKEQKESDKLFTKLESTEDKSHKLVVEQLEKMKHLFNYSKKTQ
jgi:hypothetical protein